MWTGWDRAALVDVTVWLSSSSKSPAAPITEPAASSVAAQRGAQVVLPHCGRPGGSGFEGQLEFESGDHGKPTGSEQNAGQPHGNSVRGRRDAGVHEPKRGGFGGPSNP